MFELEILKCSNKMKSVEANFRSIMANPASQGISTYVGFIRAISGKHLNRTMVLRWFNKLVDKEDYEGVPKTALLHNVIAANNG
jgi:hypothetical protein